MKAVYVKTIFEKFDEAILESRKIGRIIDYFEVSKEEFRELTILPPDQAMYYMYNGFRVKVVK